nr:Hok/Gef family protein [Escherichia coli]
MVHLRQTVITVITDIVTALVTRKDLCEVRIRTGQTEVAVFTAYEPEE